MTKKKTRFLSFFGEESIWTSKRKKNEENKKTTATWCRDTQSSTTPHLFEKEIHRIFLNLKPMTDAEFHSGASAASRKHASKAETFKARASFSVRGEF